MSQEPIVADKSVYDEEVQKKQKSYRMNCYNGGKQIDISFRFDKDTKVSIILADIHGYTFFAKNYHIPANQTVDTHLPCTFLRRGEYNLCIGCDQQNFTEKIFVQ